MPHASACVRAVVAAAVLAGGWFAAAASVAAPLTQGERQAIVQALRQAGETAGLESEADFNAAAIRLAREELGQRIDPTAVDRMWSVKPKPRQADAEFAAARDSGRLESWLRSLPPPFSEYRELRAAQARYRSIVEAGGWPRLSGATVLREGMRGPQVKALRRRLAAEGSGSAESGDAAQFDGDLSQALADFQRRHGLAADGVLGPDSRAALNVSAEERLRQIEANLERWRWVPRELPADRMEIDVAAAQARVLHDDTPVLQMKVVVGRPRRPTPMFASAIDSLVFNPPWYVPRSIASGELLPSEGRDPGYLARHGYHWSGRRLVQRPGPQNALGQIKFDLQSPFGVYLHDTPIRSAFDRDVRTISHGCIRLEKPQELAALLLGPLGWTPERIDEAIASGRTERVLVESRLPLYVFYWTAVADASGDVEFRPDPYGWDAKLTAAVARAALPRRSQD